jgi:hypothetical protein
MPITCETSYPTGRNSVSEIRLGDMVRGNEREQRDMRVAQIHGNLVTCEYYDETGKQVIFVSMDNLRFVADVETEAFTESRERWIGTKLNSKKQ